MSGVTSFNGLSGDDRVVVQRDADFTITNTALQAGSYNLGLAGIEAFTATGGGAVNTFDVTGWTGSGQIVATIQLRRAAIK